MENSKWYWVASATSLLTGNVGWLFPALKSEYKIIILISGILLATIIICIMLYRQNRQLKQDYEKIEKNRDYLYETNLGRKKKLETFQTWWNMLGYIIATSIIYTKEVKIENINKQYIDYTEAIRKNGGFDNDDN